MRVMPQKATSLRQTRLFAAFEAIAASKLRIRAVMVASSRHLRGLAWRLEATTTCQHPKIKP